MCDVRQRHAAITSLRVHSMAEQLGIPNFVHVPLLST